jgi:LmbE family N-acetylglucosaminyl deacetylase
VNLAGVRAGELERAAAILGISNVVQLGLEDGEVLNNPGLREALVGLVRSWRPDLVLCPDPTAFLFGNVYWNHVDHRELAMATLDAVAPAAAMPLYFPKAGAPHAVRQMLLSGTLEPDVTIDIDGFVEAKTLAVLAHASQVGDDQHAVQRVVLDRAQQAGRTVGIGYGESFRSLELAH